LCHSNGSSSNTTTCLISRRWNATLRRSIC